MIRTLADYRKGLRQIADAEATGPAHSDRGALLADLAAFELERLLPVRDGSARPAEEACPLAAFRRIALERGPVTPSHRLHWSPVMTAAKANWKGSLKFGELTCAIALYTASSSSDRIAFVTLNRATRNRVHREFIDSETGAPVSRDAQVKGYEIENGGYVVLEPEEVAAALPVSDKILQIEAFAPCREVDDVYFDKSYYLTPDAVGAEVFKLLRDGMRQAKVVAFARAVLFRRLRVVLIRPHGAGLIGTTLNFDYEVRSAQEAFDALPDLKIEGEMLALAKHIIHTKKGSFEAKSFHDRYEAAVADLVTAKIEGRAPPERQKQTVSTATDLLQALRDSAGLSPPKKRARKASAASTPTEKSKQPSRRARAA